MSQEQLASMVGLTRSALNNIERNNKVVAATATAAALAIKAAKDSGAIPSLPQKPSWRNSKGFKQRPPFEVLPSNGSGCGCGDRSCRLYAVCDGDWPSGHLWCFQARGCHRRVYLDAMGKPVPSPGKNVSRVPAQICSGCGRKQSLDMKHSKRFGQKIYIRRCRQEPEDPPSLRHDPPSYWWDKNGKMVRMPQAAIEELHGRSRRSFPVPKCHLEGCPRHGLTMERSAVLNLSTRDGGKCQIAMYRCRASKPHTEYRVLPQGEVAMRLGLGRYSWTESATASTVETAPRKRPLQARRKMPSSNCPECGASLRQGAGPWKLQGGRRRWNTECSNCHKVYRVRNDGEITAHKDSRWRKTKGGAPSGPRPRTIERCKLAATLSRIGCSQREMAPYVLDDQPNTAKHNIRRFFSDHRLTIEGCRKNLTDAEISELLTSYKAHCSENLRNGFLSLLRKRPPQFPEHAQN